MEHSKDQKYFIFNINTSDVAGAIVFFDKKKNKPVIEYSVKRKINIDRDDVLSGFRLHTKQSLEKVCEGLMKYLKISGDIFGVEEAFVFTSSPWVRKDIKTIVEEKISFFLVSEKFLDTFTQQGQQPQEGEILLHSELIKTSVNGYDVFIQESVNKKASKVEASFLNSYASEKDINFINGVIKESFSFIKITNTSFLPTFFSQIRKVYDTEEDFAFMDFTGEILEFGVHQDKAIKNIISLETGKNKILRGLILNNTAVSLQEAEYILSLYLQERLDPAKAEEVEEVVKVHAEYIRENIAQELESYEVFQVPKKVFVVSSGEMNQLVKKLDLFEEHYFVGRSFLKNFIFAVEEQFFDNFLAIEADFVFNRK